MVFDGALDSEQVAAFKQLLRDKVPVVRADTVESESVNTGKTTIGGTDEVTSGPIGDSGELVNIGSLSWGFISPSTSQTSFTRVPDGDAFAYIDTNARVNIDNINSSTLKLQWSIRKMDPQTANELTLGIETNQGTVAEVTKTSQTFGVVSSVTDVSSSIDSESFFVPVLESGDGNDVEVRGNLTLQLLAERK